MRQRPPITRTDLVRDLKWLGVPPGALLMVHSSLRSLGEVDRGAESVVDALLETLGPDGTLVVPTFTFATARAPGFVFDPQHTPSDMGAITEAARRRPEARRSVHIYHSIAALGPLAEQLTTSGGDSAWDAASPMGQVLDRDGWYLLLGVPYQTLTAVHVIEIRLGVWSRLERVDEGRQRLPDGSVVPLFSRTHPRHQAHPGSDFNRAGQRMEDSGLVAIGEVGNAVARLFRAQDLLTTVAAMYATDRNATLQQGPAVTALAYGHTIPSPRGEYCVADPARLFGT
ncbi:MAG: AAC(3) family N-acetyltransferase [Actinobacteria bacterium]|nr:AAC(3) family N-acetyltransferase [Actinomycetota bacterium]